MSEPEIPEISVNARLADLRGGSYVVSDGGTRFGDMVAVQVDDGPRSQVTRITVGFQDGEAEPRSLTLPSGTTLAEALKQALDFTGEVIAPVATIEWPRPPGRLPRPRSTVMMLIPAVAIALMAGLRNPAVGILAGAITFMLVIVLWILVPSSHRAGTQALDSDGRPVVAPTAVAGRADAGRLPGGQGPRRSPAQRVGAIKETYGALLSDIVYRIENSALFDSAQPLSREFQLLLMRWDEEQVKLPGPEKAKLAREIEMAFDTARRHAETVGLTHLPQTARDDGQRAAKAARLAQSATTAGEREAALAQATRLLRSLALYYLPSPEEAPRMLGGERPQIER